MRMIKLICLLIVLLMHGSVSAYADCDHLYRILEQDESRWVIISDTEHAYRNYWWEVCDYCGDTALVYMEFSPEPHEFEREEPGWHIDGEYVHHYQETCRICGYSKRITIPCTGTYCIKYDAIERRR